MSSKLIDAVNRNVLQLDKDVRWVKDNLHYEVVMGSQAYGVSQDSSDMDIYGWCIPPKRIVLPHTAGYVDGFGPRPQNFNCMQRHHVDDPQRKMQYDFAIYGIVSYMNLVAENNPNMIDSLFVPNHCVLHVTPAGLTLRDRRRQFLHLGAYHKFKGYAFSQMHKMRIKQPDKQRSTKRHADIEKNGYDTKYAYHLVRLLGECEQILKTGDLDLQQDNERLKAIRRGEYKLTDIEQIFEKSEKHLEDLYRANPAGLPESPDWKALTNILLNILESHYGSIAEVARLDRSDQLLEELQQLVDRYQ